MQQTLQELMDICTSLQRQHSLLEERVQTQDLEITQLKTRIKTLKDNKKRREGFAQEDAPNTRGIDQGEDLLVGDTMKDSDKSADKGSDSTDEMSHILGSLEASNILASGGLRSVFTTASLSVATASIDISPVVATASGSFPTAVIFTTTSVATPTTRVTRSSRGVVIGSSSLISVNIPFINKKDKRKEKMTEPEQPSKDERDAEIARIHAEKELKIMIAELDRSNEMIAKYLNEYEQAAVGLSHDEKVELINGLLMYQRIKELKTAKASGTEPTQEQQSEDPKEISEEELKRMMELVPVEELYIEALQSLVKKTCSTTEVTDEKAKGLWVELKRLYEHDYRDPLWALQRYMHDPLVWRLYDTCGVHHVSIGRGHQIFMLVEKDYPLTKGLTTLMVSNKLQVDQYS
uniref:Uncharacterized protein n=1 Tax=Tanacetum cinerariifolium TaxID=118510 RepID=A0A6L2JFS9_TANCI|nr:hypothetical protein [Tanacetum cinerariifolium]